jgi:PPOX class probable FMN-dependent enzyme
MSLPFDDVITSTDELRSLYAKVGERARLKQIDHLDSHCREFISRACFVMVATSGPRGSCDVSPKGGRPGFVAVLDEHRLAIPDLHGNNRLDSMQNLLANPNVGLLFLIPKVGETLRVNGRAFVTKSSAVLDAATVDGMRPRVAIGVEVEEAYIHCAKSIRRAGLWDPEKWPDPSDMTPVACMLKDHAKIDGVTGEQVEAALESGYRSDLWKVGGREPVA